MEIVENLKNKTLIVTTILVSGMSIYIHAFYVPYHFFFLFFHWGRTAVKHNSFGMDFRMKNLYFNPCSSYPVLPSQSAPYCMRKDSPEKLSGNDQFEGYATDLIHEISRLLGFNYTIRLAPDGRYGSYNKETGYGQYGHIF